jgi:hypothetical protein
MRWDTLVGVERRHRSADVRGRQEEPAVQRRVPLTSPEQLLALQRSAGNAAVARFMLARKRAEPPAQSAEKGRWDRANALYQSYWKRGNGFWERLGLQAQLNEGTPVTAASPAPDQTRLYDQNYDTAYVDNPEGYLEVRSTHKGDSEVYHMNYFFPNGRIQANSNYGKSKKPGVTPLHNNIVLWIQFGLARKRQSQMPVAPTELVRGPIWDHDTNDVIWLCLPEAESEAEFTGGTDDMKALLGTDNGIAAAYMIFDNRVAKGISSIKASYTGATGAMTIRFDQPATEVVTPVLDNAAALGEQGVDEKPGVLTPGSSAHVNASATSKLTFYEFKDEAAAMRWDEERESMEEGPASVFADKNLVLIERRSADNDSWLVQTKGDYGPIYALLPGELLRASK